MNVRSTSKMNSQTPTSERSDQESNNNIPSANVTTTTTTTKSKQKQSVRHAEKRRTATCLFADRVAQLSIDHYRRSIPKEEQQVFTCLATIVALYEDGTLTVVSMGVGTKFLSESLLRQEVEEAVEHVDVDVDEKRISSKGYGRRVRDCHAEVLARRAFRREITMEILKDLRSSLSSSEGDNQNKEEESVQHCKHSLLVRVSSDGASSDTDERETSIRYKLTPGMTLHMYASSAPCGNSTLKKFSKMKKEYFRDQYGPHEWPKDVHGPIHGHSIKLGQFALLLKKDNSKTSKRANDTTSTPTDTTTNNETTITTTTNVVTTTTTTNADNTADSPRTGSNTSTSKQKQVASLSKSRTKGKVWPAMIDDNWTPPGTTIVHMKEYGSIHTCSDKICRWNFLGLQGSLLSQYLTSPIYMSTLIVGRKFTECICRRAVCCRMGIDNRNGTEQENLFKDICLPAGVSSTSEESAGTLSPASSSYRMNHPSILGTSVHVDETAIVETDSTAHGQDVRFHSVKCWAWWPSIDVVTTDNTKNNTIDNEEMMTSVECIDGSTGLLFPPSSSDTNDEKISHDRVSQLCTQSLTKLYLDTRIILDSNQQQQQREREQQREKVKDDDHDKVSTMIDGDSMEYNFFMSNPPKTLLQLRQLKQSVSKEYESIKDIILTKHRLMKDWRRRSERIVSTVHSSFKNDMK